MKSVAHGILTSFVLFFVTYGAFKDGITPEGTNLDGHQLIGTVVSTILVLVVTAQVISRQRFCVLVSDHYFLSFTDRIGHCLLDRFQSCSNLGIGSFLLCHDIVYQFKFDW